MMLWVIILGIICVTWIIAWLLYAHRKLGKPLPKVMKLLIIALIICVLIVTIGEILSRFV